jgi:hypothetical protein
MKDFKKFCNETLFPVIVGIGFVIWDIIILPFDIIQYILLAIFRFIEDIVLAVWLNLYSRAELIFEFPDMVKEVTKD